MSDGEYMKFRKVERSRDRVRRLQRRLSEVPEGDPATEALLDVVKGIVDILEEAVKV